MEKQFRNQEGLFFLQLFSLKYIENVAIKTLQRLPENLQKKLSHLQVCIENFATQSALVNLQMDNRYDLLGLYQGVPFFKKEQTTHSTNEDILFLYRCPIIRYTQEYKEDIDEVIEHIILHELSHHFMISKRELTLSMRKNEN